MRAPIAVAGLTAALLLSSCGGDDEKPQEPPGRVQEVSNAVRALQQATAKRDFDRICSELFSEEVQKQAGGKQCPKLLEQTSKGVRNPKIKVLKVTIEGNRAKVRVQTSASGQEPVTETLEMVRQDGAYKVAALSR